MKNQLLMNEVFWLRCIACLAVTLGHAIGNGFHFYMEPNFFHSSLYVLHMAVLFGVPVFVFISELLLANKYTENVPKGFMMKRVKILLLPYLVMSIVYAIISIDTWTLQAVVSRLAMSIFLGDSAVYFILIIFQFYFLHLLLRKYLNHLSAKFVIPLALVINFLYLAFFNFVESPNNTVGHFIWTKGYWMPFAGWIFYFVLGFYCGRNYHNMLTILKKRWVLVAPILSLLLLLIINKVFYMDYDSKRVDMLIYSTSVIFFIMYIASRIKQVPKLVMFISNHSFSIFLLNLLYFHLLRYIEPPAFLNVVSYTLLVFLLTMLLCIGTAYLFNQFSFGKYFVGRIMTYNVEDKIKGKPGSLAAIKDSK
ncbi:Membrane-bound acyltransferase YfiQ, involved in biofilm formation [Virgibacillus subterraneus]|uniref:Membrane-bound acyltransferase YfiQ, involved in biofilm formation n=1 Tax=Virgibacillus subterraneus TaxID=621109 RepID=A0A1H8ZT25_9BACI|nr:acyltransferase family protein [Virgibacillus subterraneus]SEP67606.1 Membrane-bound acyltransferase YfiQ, involved in biofilm formation [Virgibacillus subterraneus]